MGFKQTVGKTMSQDPKNKVMLVIRYGLNLLFILSSSGEAASISMAYTHMYIARDYRPY